MQLGPVMDYSDNSLTHNACTHRIHQGCAPHLQITPAAVHIWLDSVVHTPLGPHSVCAF